MHDALRQRLLRRIESLPDAQVYQVLDFIEFLESKYAGTEPVEASGLQKFAESLEDKLRKKAVSPATIREAFQLISAADRVLHGVSSAGKQILTDLNQAWEAPSDEAESSSGPDASRGGPRSGSGGGSPGQRGSRAGDSASASGRSASSRPSSSRPTSRNGGSAPPSSGGPGSSAAPRGGSDAGEASETDG